MNKKEKAKNRFLKHKLTSAVVFSMSLAPLVAPMAKAAVSSMPIGNLQGLPGDTYTYNLEQVFGSESSDSYVYSVINSADSVASVQISGSLLQIVLKSAGTTNVQLSARNSGGITDNPEFSVQVLSVGSDNRFDVGDLTSYAKTAASVDSVNKLIERVEPQQTAKNHAPTVQRSVYEMSVLEGQSVPNLDLASFFSDPDGDALSYQLTSPDSRGLSASVSGSVAIFSGAMSDTTVNYIITATDSRGSDSKSATSVLTINPGNHAPISVVEDTYAMYYPLHTNVITPVSVALTDIFRDHENDPMTYTVVGATYSNGVTAAVYNDTASLQFGGNLTAPAQFVVQATDSQGASSAPVTVRLGELVAKRSLYEEYYTVDGEEGYCELPFSDLFVGSVASFDPVTTANGITFNYEMPSGNYIYFSGLMTADTTFTITAHDADGNSASTVIHLKLNYAPSATKNKVKIVVPTGETIPSTTIDVSQYFSDLDGDTLQYYIYPYSGDSDFSVTTEGNTFIYSGTMSQSSSAGVEIYADDDKGGEGYLDLQIEPDPVNVENKIQNAYMFKNFTGNIASVNLRDNFSDRDERELSFDIDPTSVIPDGYQATVSGDYLNVAKKAGATEANTPSTFDVKIKATENDTYETGDPLNTGYATYRFNEFSNPTTVEVDNSTLSSGYSFDLNSDLLNVNESTVTGLEASLLDETSSWLTLTGDTGDTTISLASGTTLSGATATVSLTVSNNLSQTATKLVTFKSTDFGSAQLRDRSLNWYQKVNLGDLNRRYGITDPINYHAKALFDSLDGSFENGSEFSLDSFATGSNVMGVLGLDAKTGNGRIDTFNVSAADSDELYFRNPFAVSENFSTSNIVSSDPLFKPSMTLTDNYITITPNYVGTEPYGVTDFTVYATNDDGTIASKVKVHYTFGLE